MDTTLICSIVIPIYNVASYLRQCLDSISDVFDDKRFEILLINDGSTDGSDKIAAEYEKSHANIAVINKENGGLSDARNAGLEISRGEFVVFIDSDDWMERGAIVKMLDFIEETGCDVVQCDLYYTYEDHVLYEKKEEQPVFYSNTEAMYELIRGSHIKNFAWGKIYRRSVIGNCRFEKGKFFEDSFWQHQIIGKSKQVGCMNMTLYYYRQRNGGISGTFSNRNFDLIQGYFERLSYVESNYPQFVSVMEGMIAQLLWVYRSYCICDSELEAVWQQQFRRYCDRCINKNWRYWVMRMPFMFQICINKAFAIYNRFTPDRFMVKYINAL